MVSDAPTEGGDIQPCLSVEVTPHCKEMPASGCYILTGS
jgi:hypothetical protein